jgi:putative flippase GtrA
MFLRYGCASALSLIADWSCLLALSSLAGVDVSFAALGSYALGGIVNYTLSRRFVFRSQARGRRQASEAVRFAVSCLVGALLTAFVVEVTVAAVGDLISKAIAVVVTWFALYWLRRLVVFDRRSLRQPSPEPLIASMTTGTPREGRS